MDGDRWRLVVVAGKRVEHVEVAISGSEMVKLGTITGEELEVAVERLAVNFFPPETRVDDLLAVSPVWLRADEIRV